MAAPLSSAWQKPTQNRGGEIVKLARTCAQLGAVLSVGITLALMCDHLAALLDAALMI